MKKTDVVITHMGIVSSIGMNVAAFEKNLFAGKSGVKNIRGTMVPQNFPVPYAAYVGREELTPSKLYPGKDAEALKSWLMTEQATWEALAQLLAPVDAVVYGTADGCSYEIVEEILKEGLPEHYDFHKVCSESSLYAIQKILKLKGLADLSDDRLVAINSACATGNQSIGIAMEAIQSGRWKRVVVGGVDARCEPSNYLNFFLLGALTADEVAPEKASRPFSKDRSGFVRGEGAAVLVMESLEEAQKRGAEILGYVRGYGCTSDAYRLTDGREDAASVIEAMKHSLSQAGLKPSEISYINAHGTSTPLNDRLETYAIKKVFGKELIVSQCRP